MGSSFIRTPVASAMAFYDSRYSCRPGILAIREHRKLLKNHVFNMYLHLIFIIHSFQ